MTTPSITAFLDVAATVLSAVPDVRTAEVGRGRYTGQELAASSFEVPALRIAAAAIKRNEAVADGTRDLILRAGIAIITRDGRDGPRERQAVALLDHLMVMLPTNPWGLEWAGEPEAIDAVNAYSGSVGRTGLMVWEVGFDQQLRVGTSAFETWPGALTQVTMRGPAGGETETFGEADNG
jgi:hypothetical protein